MDNIEFLEKERKILQNFVVKYGEDVGNDSLSLIKEDLTHLDSIQMNLENYRNLQLVIESILDLSKNRAGLIQSIENKLNINIESLLANKASEPVVTDNNSSSANPNFIEFNINEHWRKLSPDEKKEKYSLIQSINKNGLTEMEISMIKYISETRQYILDYIYKDSGDKLLELQATINSLVDKNLLVISDSKSEVYLTNLGAWFYGLITHKNPFVIEQNL